MFSNHLACKSEATRTLRSVTIADTEEASNEQRRRSALRFSWGPQACFPGTVLADNPYMRSSLSVADVRGARRSTGAGSQ